MKLILLLVVIEIVLRVFKFVPLPLGWDIWEPDPQIGFGLRPDFEQTIELANLERNFYVVHNDKGLRVNSKKHALDIPPPPPKVLGIGDSFMYGWGVEYRETWLHKLGRKMKCEVVNAGIPGFNANHMRKWVEYYSAEYNPEVIVVAFTDTDALPEDSICVGNKLVDTRLSIRLMKFLHNHSHLCRLIINNLIVPTLVDDPDEKQWESMKAEFVKLKKATNAHVILVHIDSSGYKLDTILKDMSAWARQNDMEYIGVALRGDDNFREGHPNEWGHDKIARIVYENTSLSSKE